MIHTGTMQTPTKSNMPMLCHRAPASNYCTFRSLVVCENFIPRNGPYSTNLNVFSSSWILERSDNAAEAWRMAGKGVIIDDVCVFKVSSCPQVVCADGNFG